MLYDVITQTRGGGKNGHWKVWSIKKKKKPMKPHCKLRQDPPPLDLSFWSFLTFLHHGIEEVERHLL